MAAEIQQAQRRDWMQLIDRLQQDHIILKNELAEAVRAASDRQILEEMEYFQNSFLNKDAILALLRHEITVLNDKERLQEDIQKIAIGFSRLKVEFHEYLRISGIDLIS